jgi:hypothetical protein
MRVFIASVFIFLACSSNGNPTAIKVTDLPEKREVVSLPTAPVVVTSAPSVATAEAAASYTCATACANMLKLKHRAVVKLAKGRCEKVCADVQASKLVKWNVKCRTKAKTVKAVDQCERP